jgi:hypothetical protein
MKKFISVILLLIFSSALLCAEDNKFSVALSYEKHIYDNHPQNVLGINLEYFLSDNISLNYNYNFSLSPQPQWRHTPIMTYLGWELLYPVLREIAKDSEDESADPSWALTAFLLSVAIPEGVNFHFPWRDNSNTGIVVSLNPFGFEYINGYETFSSGITLQSRFGLGDNFFLSPLAGFNYAYKAKAMIFRIGLSAGMMF